MKKTIFVMGAACIMFACTDTKTNADETVAAASATTPTTTKAPSPDSATIARAWQDYMTPGEFHKMIAKDNGRWTAEMTMWMEPGKPPHTQMLNTENTMIMNGLYQQGRHTGDMMGMKFEGISTTGFNKARKMIESTWIDNMGSGIMYMEGNWDEDTKVMNLKGKSVDPVSQEEYNVREIYKVVDENNHLMEMFETRDGEAERKTMEIKFKRKI